MLYRSVHEILRGLRLTHDHDWLHLSILLGCAKLEKFWRNYYEQLEIVSLTPHDYDENINSLYPVLREIALHERKRYGLICNWVRALAQADVALPDMARKAETVYPDKIIDATIGLPRATVSRSNSGSVIARIHITSTSIGVIYGRMRQTIAMYQGLGLKRRAGIVAVRWRLLQNIASLMMLILHFMDEAAGIF